MTRPAASLVGLWLSARVEPKDNSNSKSFTAEGAEGAEGVGERRDCNKRKNNKKFLGFVVAVLRATFARFALERLLLQVQSSGRLGEPLRPLRFCL